MGPGAGALASFRGASAWSPGRRRMGWDGMCVPPVPSTNRLECGVGGGVPRLAALGGHLGLAAARPARSVCIREGFSGHVWGWPAGPPVTSASWVRRDMPPGKLRRRCLVGGLARRLGSVRVEFREYVVVHFACLAHLNAQSATVSESLPALLPCPSLQGMTLTMAGLGELSSWEVTSQRDSFNTLKAESPAGPRDAAQQGTQGALDTIVGPLTTAAQR